MTKGELIEQLKVFKDEAEILISVAPNMVNGESGDDEDSNLELYTMSPKVWMEIDDTGDATIDGGKCLIHCLTIYDR